MGLQVFHLTAESEAVYARGEWVCKCFISQPRARRRAEQVREQARAARRDNPAARRPARGETVRSWHRGRGVGAGDGLESPPQARCSTSAPDASPGAMQHERLTSLTISQRIRLAGSGGARPNAGRGKRLFFKCNVVMSRPCDTYKKTNGLRVGSPQRFVRAARARCGLCAVASAVPSAPSPHAPKSFSAAVLTPSKIFPGSVPKSFVAGSWAPYIACEGFLN